MFRRMCTRIQILLTGSNLILSPRRFEQYWVQFYNTDVELHLAIDASAYKVAMRKSEIRHPVDLVNSFSFLLTEEGKVVWYHYGLLFYLNKSKEGQKTKTNGESMMQVTAKTFET